MRLVFVDCLNDVVAYSVSPPHKRGMALYRPSAMI